MKTFFYAFCFMLAAFVRVYRISDIPYGIHIDEAGMGYDAWLLQQYHVDRWLNRLPVYLINFGGGQSALYAYLAAIFIKLSGGGIDVVWLRMPGVILNLAGYIAGIYIIGKSFEEKWKMFSAFLLAVLPYFIMQCRFGLDCNLLVNMLTISFCFLYLALEYKKTWIFIVTGISYGITYYTYALSYIPNTIILLFVTGYLLYNHIQLWKKLIYVWIFAAFTAFPLLMMLFINQFDLSQVQIGIITITKIPEYRGSEFVFDFPTIIKNVGIVLSSILTRDWLDYNAFDRFYTMYRISIPFIVIGFIDCTKRMIKNIKAGNVTVDYSIFPWFVFVVYFIFGCLLGGTYPANVNKMNGIFFSQFFLLIWGIRTVYHLITGRYRKAAQVFMGVLCLIYLFNFVSFADYYFTDYASDIYPQEYFADTYEDILVYLQENRMENEQTYVTSSHIYYLLSTKEDPYEFNVPGWETMNYRNYHFFFPDEIDSSAVYILRETDGDYKEILEENGLHLQYEEGMYQCYYKDIAGGGL